jgi:hypothetical protein
VAAKYWVPNPITAVANNGSGKARFTVANSIASWSYNPTVNIFGTSGAYDGTGLTTTWVDSTHFDTTQSFTATATGSVNGPWDNTNVANWMTASGGSTETTVPTSGDTPTFDGSSGSGTVTLSSAINNLSVATISCGAFGGTLDNSVANNTITCTTQFFGSGTGARTIKWGTGTLILSGNGNFNPFDFTTTTNLTNPTTAFSSATLNFTGTLIAASNIQTGGMTFGTINLSFVSGAYYITLQGSPTITNLNITAPIYLLFPTSGSITVTNINFNSAGSSSGQSFISSTNAASHAAISSSVGGTAQWCAFRSIAFSGGGSLVAANSFDLGNNTGLSVTAPSGGGGASIVMG